MVIVSIRYYHFSGSDTRYCLVLYPIKLADGKNITTRFYLVLPDHTQAPNHTIDHHKNCCLQFESFVISLL
jgi:hypothetical protein